MEVKKFYDYSSEWNDYLYSTVSYNHFKFWFGCSWHCLKFIHTCFRCNRLGNHQNLHKAEITVDCLTHWGWVTHVFISKHGHVIIMSLHDWLLQQFDEWTTGESHQETAAGAKHSCQTSFQSEEIWSHNSCTRYASLASSQIPDWIQNTVDRLQRTSWQGTYLHPRNDLPIKKQKIFHKIQWRTCPEGSKIQAWYFWQACIRSVWASGMELLAKGN